MKRIGALTGATSGLVSGDICLVKASRAAGLERICEAVATHFSQEPLALDSTGNTAAPSRKVDMRPEARA